MHRPDEAHAFWLRCWFALVFITGPGHARTACPSRQVGSRPNESLPRHRCQHPLRLQNHRLVLFPHATAGAGFGYKTDRNFRLIL